MPDQEGQNFAKLADWAVNKRVYAAAPDLLSALRTHALDGNRLCFNCWTRRIKKESPR